MIILGNKYLVFDSIPGTELLKYLEFCREDVFCYVNVRMRAGCKLSIPPTTCLPPLSLKPSERRQGLEIEFNSVVYNLINHVINEALIQTQKDEVQDLMRWSTGRDLERVVCSEKSWELQALSPHLALCIYSINLFLSYIIL